MQNRLLLTLIVCLVSFAPTAAADRPNILWITAEDMSPVLGCYGDEFARTPNLDQLARESVLYTNAFATSPVCSPTRSTLITGMYSTSLGTHDLRSAFPLPRMVRAWPSALREAGYYTTNNVKTDYNTSDEPRLIKEAWNESSPTAHWQNRAGNQPFFAVVNDMTTHQSRTGVWPRERFEQQVQSRLPSAGVHDPAKVPVPPYYPDTPTIRRGLARFYDCVSVMDQNVGKLLAELKAAGVYEETIIFFYSDHGSGMPRGKRVLNDSGLRVPLLIRFPAKYRHLAPAAPGTRTDRLVSFIDFPPSVLSLLELPIPDYMQGEPFLGPRVTEPRSYVFGARDRVDEAYDKSRSVRTEQFLYIRNFRPDRSLNQPSVYSDFSEVRRTITRMAEQNKLTGPQLAYAGSSRPAEELYDVVRDPENLVNLAARPEYRETVHRLANAAARWALETRDLGLLSEEHLREFSADHASPWDWAGAPGNFPSESLLVASQLIGRGPVALRTQQRLLHHTDPSVRLQALFGLVAQQNRTPAAIAALEAATKDKDMAVRIEAAAAVGNAEVLGQALTHTSADVVLRASRGLELLGQNGKSQIPAMEAALARWRDREDGPIPLFIRFSLERALTNLGQPPEEMFKP